MKNLLLVLSLLTTFLLVSCDKEQEKVLQEGSCAACQDIAFEDPKAPLPEGVSQKIVIDLVPTAGFYSKGQISYYKDRKEIATVIYKEKDGAFIGIKKTFEDSNHIPAYADVPEGSCVPNVPTRITTCCEFQQTAVK